MLSNIHLNLGLEIPVFEVYLKQRYLKKLEITYQLEYEVLRLDKIERRFLYYEFTYLHIHPILPNSIKIYGIYQKDNTSLENWKSNYILTCSLVTISQSLDGLNHLFNKSEYSSIKYIFFKCTPFECHCLKYCTMI